MHFKWDFPTANVNSFVRCAKGHKPRMYAHPDPLFGYEIKRGCAVYEPNMENKSK